MLDRLGVFQGGFTLGAAMAVCADVIDVSECVDAVSSLVEKSLVVAQESGASMRYRLLESTADFAMLRLVESGEAQTARLRHAEYLTGFVIESRAILETPDEAPALRRVEAEWRNIVAALTWCLAGEGPSEQGVRIAAGLGRVWTRVRQLSEAMQWLELARDAASPDMAQERLAILITLADVAFNTDDMRGPAWIKEARGIAEALGDQAVLPWLFYAQGVWANVLRDPGGARDALQRSAAIASENHDERGLARAALGLGRIAYFADELDEAETQLRRARRVFQRHGDQYYQSLTSTFLAQALAFQGDHAATVLLDEVLLLCVTMPVLTTDAMLARAVVDVHLDRRAEARRSLCEAITGAAAQAPRDVSRLLQNAAILAGRCQAWRQCACLTGAWQVDGTQTEVQVRIAAMAVEAAENARAVLGDAAYEAAVEDGRHMDSKDLLTLIATELGEP